MTGNRSLDDFLGGDDGGAGDDRDGDDESERDDDTGSSQVRDVGDGPETRNVADERDAGAEPDTRDAGDRGGDVRADTGSAADTALDTGTDPDAGGVDAAAVEPATPTYRWDRDGIACERCGEPVRRRWADGDAFVCGDCKEW
jgi:hypothetical protein